MKEWIEDNIDTCYAYSNKIAGHYGNDLFHELLPRLLEAKTEYPGTYLYKALSNEFFNPNSPFNKKYNPQPVELIEYESSDYDSIKLHTVLLEIENEGFHREVKLFKECYFISNINTVRKQSELSFGVIKKICNFVINEIKQRYVID